MVARVLQKPCLAVHGKFGFSRPVVGQSRPINATAGPFGPGCRGSFCESFESLSHLQAAIESHCERTHAVAGLGHLRARLEFWL
jgi:hypothetical protein